MSKSAVVRKGDVVAAAFGAGLQVSVATLVSVDDDGKPSVQINGLPGPLQARIVGEVEADAGAEVAVVFENGDRTLPLILGVVRAQLAARGTVPLLTPADAGRDLVVNGKKLRLQADTELTLSCGNASILLRKDGKLVIKGTEVVSRASGANKIRGGLVNIN